MLATLETASLFGNMLSNLLNFTLMQFLKEIKTHTKQNRFTEGKITTKYIPNQIEHLSVVCKSNNIHYRVQVVTCLPTHIFSVIGV
jgi:hypothetical protein